MPLFRSTLAAAIAVVAANIAAVMFDSTLDKYAPGGGYAFAGFPIGAKGDTAASRAYRIMRDEAHWYGREYMGYKADGERLPFVLPERKA